MLTSSKWLASLVFAYCGNNSTVSVVVSVEIMIAFIVTMRM